MSLACKDRPWKVAKGSMGVCPVGPFGTIGWDQLGPPSGPRSCPVRIIEHPGEHPLVFNPQRPCSDHHSRTAYSASSIGGGFSSAAPASLNKARAVSSNARMRSGATEPGISILALLPSGRSSARADALDPREPLIPANPVLVYALQRDAHHKMISIVVLVDLVRTA